MLLIIATLIVLITALCAVPLANAAGDSIRSRHWNDAAGSVAFLLVVLALGGIGTYACLAMHLDTLPSAS